MINLDLLKVVVNQAEGNRDFTNNLAKALGRSTSCISHKNNGVDACYTVDEVNILRKKYNIDNETLCKIFFAD